MFFFSFFLQSLLMGLMEYFSKGRMVVVVVVVVVMETLAQNGENRFCQGEETVERD